jgi:hypothetical protein
MGLTDPLGSVLGFINGLIRTHKLNEWVKLIVSMGFSFWSSFCYACGGVLIAHGAFLVGIGTGMLAGATAIAWLWMESPLTKKIMAAIPATLDPLSVEIKGIEHDK